jgi:hypothetical protein
MPLPRLTKKGQKWWARPATLSGTASCAHQIRLPPSTARG